MDKALQREKTRERVERYRQKKALQEVEAKGVTLLKSVTEKDVTQYHPILDWLIIPERREKLGRIIQSLKNHNQLENVYLGCGRHCLPMDIVSGYYEATLT